nr:hypothetical protein CFP56_16249 [Quercus suber]
MLLRSTDIIVVGRLHVTVELPQITGHISIFRISTRNILVLIRQMQTILSETSSTVHIWSISRTLSGCVSRLDDSERNFGLLAAMCSRMERHLRQAYTSVT